MITIRKNEIDKAMLRDMLKFGVYQVIFEKVDGSTRDMKCTLMTRYLPLLVEGEEEKKPRKENDSVLSVWDMDKDAWRSMRLENIISVDELEVEESEDALGT